MLLRALLASALALGAVNGEAQILPFGEFAARDGRPAPDAAKWTLDDARGAALAAALNALAAKTPIVIDYEHQTMRADGNGQPAPAAGWMRSFEWRAGTGLFAKVEWTERAKAHIAAGEYRYISPVITYDRKTGAVTGVLLAALVNHPALLGMEPVVAQLATQFTDPPQEKRMDLAVLIALLGLAGTATADDCTTFITQLLARPTAAQMPAALATALGLQAGADEAAALAALGKLKGGDASTLAAMAALQTQVATLTAQINERTITELVDGAVQGHKLLPAQRDWALTLGKSNLASLQAYIAAAQPILGLGGQSGGKDRGKDGEAALSAQAAEICAAMGLTKEQFDKAAVAA